MSRTTAKTGRKKPTKPVTGKPTHKSAPRGAVERIFGTDGVRAVAGEGPLNPENVLRLGRALGRYLQSHSKSKDRPVVLLGVDPRPSADMVGTSMAAGLIAECCDVHWPGMMSTPEVAFLTNHGPFAAGVMITASHNPATDNGIKIFGKDGGKLPDAVEREFEKLILTSGGDAEPDKSRFGWLKLAREKHYEEFIVKTFRASFASLGKKPLRVVFDCAFGARSIDLQVVSRLARSVALGRTNPEFRVGASMKTGGDHADNKLEIVFLNAASPNQPDNHHLINDNVGSLYPEACAEAVKKMKADLGVCFDGDGDRCILIDENGGIRDGDYMLALLAADLHARNKLAKNTVISTVMANYGLQEAMEALGAKLVRTDVGDRYVVEAMKQAGAVLGGEPSGHVIINDEGHPFGDGLYTALRIIEVMLESGKPLSAMCESLTKYPQLLTNVKVSSKPPLGTLSKFQKVLARAQEKLEGVGRAVVRYSGTEPVLRVMVEGKDSKLVESVARNLADEAAKALGVK
ncbi:MAG: phosphoglucosamine mutase [Planctomycetes bacterium]|nr:phosphoglucosamine mutase [Planctomycetota bacterium]